LATEVVKCSNCGAALPSRVGSEGLHCEYCGTLNVLEEEPAAPVREQPARPSIDLPKPAAAVSPAAKPRAGGGCGPWVALIVLIIGGVAFWLVRRPGWEGVHGVIFTDLNGDGVPDFVGREQSTLGVSIGAFDGNGGGELWSGPYLGAYLDTYQGTLGLAGDTVLFSMPTGELYAFGAKDGKKRWTTRLQDKATGFCKGSTDAEVIVQLGGKITTLVRLSDGGVAAASGAASPCVQLPDDHPAGDPSCATADAGKYQVEGMTVETALKHPGGPTILVGYHATGTNVPMIAAADGASWKSDVPAARPLETEVDGFGGKAAISSTRVFTEYSFRQNSDLRGLVAFDFAGHRLWEIEMGSDQPLTAIQATETRVFVSQWGELHVYDAATGKKVRAIGAFF
jgi:outer membrane protein assembly factor BamB/DNA-directed RNA polymerase subunit RPC12/RpoP